MLLGGVSDPRNKNFITLIGPDYRLISGQNKRRKQATEANYIAIRKYLKEHGLSKTNDIAAAIELSPARTRVLLKEMSDVSLLRQAGGPDHRADLGRQQIFVVT